MVALQKGVIVYLSPSLLGNENSDDESLRRKKFFFFAAIDLLYLKGQSGDIFIAFFNRLGYA
jgi:hypothetical protein